MQAMIESGGVVSSVTPEFAFGFDITKNGARKAFQVLCSSLYSDKIGAVVRETVCNAVDSHVFSKQARPVDVHCPTRMNPSFRVRDYGKGLRQDEIQRVYCTLFSSSKETSNDFTGYLGLGSKSPFAYTDSFVVESIVDRDDGTRLKTVYSLLRDGDDIPVVGVMSSGETTDETGLNIIIPVTTYDNGDFIQACRKYLPYFDDKVKLHGYPLEERNMFLDKTKLTDNGQRVGYRIIRHHNGSRLNTGNIICVMGNVPYAVDDKYVPSRMRGNYNRVTIEIFVKIGDVSVAPSREGLSYDKITEAFIQAIINSTFASIDKDLSQEVSKQTSWLDAVKTVEHVLETCGCIGANMNSHLYESKFVGGQIFKPLETDNVIYSVTSDGHVSIAYKNQPQNIESIQYWYNTKWRNVLNFRIEPDIALYVDDVKRGGLGRIKNGHKSSSRCYVIQDWMRTDLIKCGLPESVFKYSSSMERPPVVKRTQRVSTGVLYAYGSVVRITHGIGTHAIHKKGNKYLDRNGEPISAEKLRDLVQAYPQFKIYFTTDKSVPANLWTELDKLPQSEYYCPERVPRLDEENLKLVKLPIVKTLKDDIETIRGSSSLLQRNSLAAFGIHIKENKTDLQKTISRIKSEYPILAEFIGLDPNPKKLAESINQLYGDAK